MILKQETVKSWFTGVNNSINNEIVQPFRNAEQIIYKYNQAIQYNSLTQQGWKRLLAQSDDGLKTYLKNIKGTTASMAGYSVSLQGNITGFTKASSIIKQYNNFSTAGIKEQNTFATAVSTINGNLGTYLINLNGAKASLGSYGISLINSTAKTIGLTVATTALNATLTTGISLIVSGLIAAFTSWINKSEQITKKAQEAVDRVSSINDNLKSDIETVDKTKKRYAELAQEVENLGKTTQNKGTLNNEEYEEFLNLSNQLAGIFPSLSKNYDENGNAILDLSGNVDTIVGTLDNLIQKEKELANQKITKELPDIFSGYTNNLSSAQRDVKNAQTEYDKINNAYQQLSKGSAIQAFKYYNNGTLKGSFESADGKIIEINYQEYIQAAKDLGLEIKEEKLYSQNQFGGKDYQGIRVELIGNINTAFTSKIETAKKNLQFAQQQLEIQKSEINSYLNSWLQNDYTYNNIKNGKLQQAIQSMIFNFDWNSIPENIQNIKNSDERWAAVSEYLKRNILFEISELQDNPELSNALTEVFTNTELTPKEKNNYIKQIRGFFGKDHVITLSLEPQFKETKKLKEKYQNAINSSKKKFSKYDPTAFFQEHSINTQEEIDKWNEIANSAKNAKDAEKKYLENLSNGTTSSPPLSFQESWNALGTTGSDEMKQSSSEAKEQLLELAEAGKLTAEELEKSPAGKTIIDQTKLSAKEATEAVNDLVDKSAQLSVMKSGIQSISDVLIKKKNYKNSKKKEEDGISPETLAGVDDGIKKMDSWKHFEKTLGNGKSSMEACQKAASKLATEWVSSNNFLSRLNKTNEEYYISALKGMGIANAEDVILSQLIAKGENVTIGKLSLKEATDKVRDAESSSAEETQKNIAQLQKEMGWTNNVATALQILYIKENILNNSSLGADTRVQELKKWAKALLGTATAAEILETAYNAAANASTTGSDTLARQKAYNDSYENAFNDKLNELGFDSIFNTSGNGSDSDNNNPEPPTTPTPTAPKETKQSFDWLERKVTVLTNKLDLLKAKIENVFSVREKNSVINDEIKKTNALINAYKKQEKTYKAQANKSAKSQKTATGNDKAKLSGKKGKKLKKQIQTGQIKGSKKQWIDMYGESTANAIEEYQDYWDKYQSAQKNRQDAIKSKRELKIQKRQNWVDYYDSLGSQYDAQIEIAATAKVKNKLEKDKLKYIEKSYNQQIKIAKLEQDSVKASTLLAQKWKEIADSRERILQNQLDENAAKRDYNNAAYENADNAGKKSLAQANIAAYNKDDQAYAENVKSAQKNVDTANGNISKTAKSASKRLKKESIDSKIVKEINGYLNSGKKVPDKYMKMAEYTYPKLYQKLLAYNNSIDAAEIAKNALAKAQENQQKAAEENQASRREERSKIIQLDIDAATNSKDLLSAQYNNLSSAKEKNNNIDAQLQQQEIIHNKTMDQIKNDITDPAERETALEKEKAEWITTQREQSVLKLQNLADEESAQYTLKQQMEANADTAKEKNKYEAESLEHLKSQYDYEMQIAKENGDQTEQDRLRLELEQKIEESYQRQIANIREEYELMIGMNDARKSTIDAQIAALQANGYGASKELLQQQMALEEDSYQKTLEEIERISEKIPTLSGDARIEAEKDLEAEKQKAWGFQQNLGELQKAINDIDLAKIERIGTALEFYGNNLDYIQDILSHSDFTLSDSEIGGLTTEGLASTAVTFAQIANNQEQIANIYDQIAEKRRQLADTNLENGDPLTEEIDTLIQKAHDLEKANYDYGESIKTMVIDSLNSLSDALDENISKHKEALQAKKDLYDYNQKIAKQLKSISSLEKQLAALQGSDTEEAQARIQKLQIQLEDEQQNLKDMEYEKYIQDQEELLDKVSDDFQDFIASVADSNVSDICAAMSNIVSDNLPAIGTAIEDAFAESSKIGELATGISGLSEMIEKLNFSGNVSTDVDKDGNIHYGYTDDNGNKVDITVDNNDKPNTITALTVNGENIPLPEKEVSKTEDRLNEATSGMYTKGGDNRTGSRIQAGLLTAGVIPDHIKAILDEKGYHLANTLKEKLLVSRINEMQKISSEQMEQFQKLTEYLVPLNTIAETITSLSTNLTSANQSPVSTTTIHNMDIHLDGSHVMDTDTFIQSLHNPRVLQEVSNGVSSQIGNVLSNKLGKF